MNAAGDSFQKPIHGLRSTHRQETDHGISAIVAGVVFLVLDVC
jgi:hypothetical protein